jgi:hypothetical protein
LRELYKDLDTVADVIRKRSERVERFVRIDNERVVKKISESKPEGSRRMGRPRLRWKIMGRIYGR